MLAGSFITFPCRSQAASTDSDLTWCSRCVRQRALDEGESVLKRLVFHVDETIRSHFQFALIPINNDSAVNLVMKRLL